jgi:hypothetical protein
MNNGLTCFKSEAAMQGGLAENRTLIRIINPALAASANLILLTSINA